MKLLRCLAPLAAATFAGGAAGLPPGATALGYTRCILDECPTADDVAAKQHFYLILSNQSHGKRKPYTMFISGVRAYTRPESGVAAVP